MLKQLVKLTEAGLSRHDKVQKTLSTSHVTKKLLEVYGNQPIVVGVAPLQVINVPASPARVGTPTAFSRRAVSMVNPAQQAAKPAYARLRVDKENLQKDRFASRGTEAEIAVRDEESLRIESQLDSHHASVQPI